MSRQFRSDDTSKWNEGFGNGLDGDLTISSNTTEAPIDSSCSGTAGTNSLSATNASFVAGQLILIHKSRGNTTVTAGSWELNKIASYVDGTITTAYPLQFSYNDSGADQSQVRVMKQYNNVTINNGITYTAKSWNGDVGGILAFFAKGTVTVNGTISANGGNGSATLTAGTGGGFRGGTGVTNNGAAQAWQGEGTSGASAQSVNRNGNGGGGSKVTSGGGNRHFGASGGHSSAGANGSAQDGSIVQGGDTQGNASLTTMVFGGGGGGGANGDSVNSAGGGGSGGGIILIIANEYNSSSATGVTTNGGGGGDAAYGNADGGNGAGGSILIKAKIATLGTTKNTALSADSAGASGASSAGRIHLDYKTSYTGTTNPTLDATQDLSLDYPNLGGSLLYNLL